MNAVGVKEGTKGRRWLNFWAAGGGDEVREDGEGDGTWLDGKGWAAPSASKFQ